jgi:hypothetical protein
MGTIVRLLFLPPVPQFDCGLQHVADTKMAAATAINLMLFIMEPP